ncbi:MAG: DNA/RNA non-specific endonuclease [Phycisphaerae bacterium]
MPKFRSRIVPVAVSVSLMFVCGCVSHVPASRRAHFSIHKKAHMEFTSDDVEQIERNCPFGMPDTSTDWDHGPTHYVVREGYVLQHSALDKIPIWICERVTKEQLSGDAKRRNRFAADPYLSESQRAELVDYRGTGYDRGHQAPAGNQKKSQRLKDETFYLSNMAPQVPAFNRKVWRRLEEVTRSWVKDHLGDAYMITGGFFYDADEEDDVTADGIIEYYVIGPGGVAVPTHFYKIVAAQDEQGQWHAIAFVLENREYDRPYEFEDYVRSIDWVEERTGLDFMPELDPHSEKRLERNPATLSTFEG